MLPEQAAVQHLQSGKSRQNINILLFGASLIFSINTGKIKVDKNTTFSDVRKDKVPFQSILGFTHLYSLAPLSSPGPKGLRAESARAVTGRRWEDFLARRPGSPHENGRNS